MQNSTLGLGGASCRINKANRVADKLDTFPARSVQNLTTLHDTANPSQSRKKSRQVRNLDEKENGHALALPSFPSEAPHLSKPIADHTRTATKKRSTLGLFM